MVNDHEDMLRIVSRAWGQQPGYCFFPWISGKARDKTERIQSYHEGPAFKWPKDKAKILDHLAAHEDDDIYWCPSLFETRRRRLDQAKDEHALWADLDGVDPNTIDKEYRPTIAWETSPGRYQALWIVAGGIQGASWPGRENQCLTYYLEADLGGWDTTQLLRIPGWKNHKPEYVQQYGKAPKGKLLWSGGRTYLVDDFNDLPDVPGLSIISDLLEEEVDRVDRHEVWDKKIKLGVPRRTKEFLTAKEYSGDRSEVLWQIERDLADAGCTLVEIVAIVKHSVWNKYVGRADEFKRLSTEVAKALSERSEEVHQKIKAYERDEEERLTKPTNLFAQMRSVKPPKWLVKDILTEGACGFIAGEPKSYKSWFSLDLAISVATGVPFLDTFDVLNPGPVLWIQEEDPPPLVKKRLEKIYPSKMLDRMIPENDQIFWAPSQELHGDPPIDAAIGRHFTISNGAWLSWFDEVLEEGKYRLCILDPLMMIAGDVEETRAQQMTEKIFKPLKQLARRHDSALIIVHHLRKNDPKYAQRGGQLMLGSMANHAWAEDSLYLKRGKRGEIQVERESKNSTSAGFKVTNLANGRWEPHVILPAPEKEPQEKPIVISQPKKPSSPRRKSRGKEPKAVSILKDMGPGQFSTKQIVDFSGLNRTLIHNQLTRHKNEVEKIGDKWQMKLNGSGPH